MLTYYAIANASAWTLPRRDRRWPKSVAALGLVGCAVLAFTLPLRSVITGVGVLAIGAIVWIAQLTRSRTISGN